MVAVGAAARHDIRNIAADGVEHLLEVATQRETVRALKVHAARAELIAELIIE